MDQMPTGRKTSALQAHNCGCCCSLLLPLWPSSLSAGRPSQHGFTLTSLSSALAHSSLLPCFVLSCLEAHASFCAMLISRPKPHVVCVNSVRKKRSAKPSPPSCRCGESAAVLESRLVWRMTKVAVFSHFKCSPVLTSPSRFHACTQTRNLWKNCG